MWILLLQISCAQPELEPVETGPPVDQQVVRIDRELQLAHQAWLDEDRESALAISTQLYDEVFTPIEAELAERDPLATFELEYQFGILMAAVQREDSAETLTRTVGRIRYLVSEMVNPPDSSDLESSSPEQSEEGEDSEP